MLPAEEGACTACVSVYPRCDLCLPSSVSRAQVNATNKKGRTALMKAAVSGSLSTVALLLRAGADVNLPDASGRSVLTYAVEKATGSDSTEGAQLALLLSLGRRANLGSHPEFKNIRRERSAFVDSASFTNFRSPVNRAKLQNKLRCMTLVDDLQQTFCKDAFVSCTTRRVRAEFHRLQF